MVTQFVSGSRYSKIPVLGEFEASTKRELYQRPKFVVMAQVYVCKQSQSEFGVVC
jgi:hypothetical protein